MKANPQSYNFPLRASGTLGVKNITSYPQTVENGRQCDTGFERFLLFEGLTQSGSVMLYCNKLCIHVFAECLLLVIFPCMFDKIKMLYSHSPRYHAARISTIYCHGLIRQICKIFIIYKKEDNVYKYTSDPLLYLLE